MRCFISLLKSKVVGSVVDLFIVCCFTSTIYNNLILCQEYVIPFYCIRIIYINCNWMPLYHMCTVYYEIYSENIKHSRKS